MPNVAVASVEMLLDRRSLDRGLDNVERKLESVGGKAKRIDLAKLEGNVGRLDAGLGKILTPLRAITAITVGAGLREWLKGGDESAQLMQQRLANVRGALGNMGRELARQKIFGRDMFQWADALANAINRIDTSKIARLMELTIAIQGLRMVIPMIEGPLKVLNALGIGQVAAGGALRGATTVAAGAAAGGIPSGAASSASIAASKVAAQAAKQASQATATAATVNANNIAALISQISGQGSGTLMLGSGVNVATEGADGVWRFATETGSKAVGVAGQAAVEAKQSLMQMSKEALRSASLFKSLIVVKKILIGSIVKLASILAKSLLIFGKIIIPIAAVGIAAASLVAGIWGFGKAIVNGENVFKGFLSGANSVWGRVTDALSEMVDAAIGWATGTNKLSKQQDAQLRDIYDRQQEVRMRKAGESQIDSFMDVAGIGGGSEVIDQISRQLQFGGKLAATEAANLVATSQMWAERMKQTADIFQKDLANKKAERSDITRLTETGKASEQDSQRALVLDTAIGRLESDISKISTAIGQRQQGMNSALNELFRAFQNQERMTERQADIMKDYNEAQREAFGGIDTIRAEWPEKLEDMRKTFQDQIAALQPSGAASTTTDLTSTFMDAMDQGRNQKEQIEKARQEHAIRVQDAIAANIAEQKNIETKMQSNTERMEADIRKMKEDAEKANTEQARFYEFMKQEFGVNTI